MVRIITLFLLVLVIGLTTVELAAARGQAPAVGTMVICTGTGPVHIIVDENGQPTGGVMICPDYAMAFFADVNTLMPEALRRDTWHPLWRSHTDSVSSDPLTPQPHARGPPSSV